MLKDIPRSLAVAAFLTAAALPVIAAAQSAGAGEGAGNYLAPKPDGLANYRIPVPPDLPRRLMESRQREGGAADPFAGMDARLEREHDRARAASAVEPGQPVTPNAVQIFILQGSAQSR